MEDIIVKFSNIVNDFTNDPVLKALCFIIISILFAKIADFIFSFLIKKIVSKTKSDIDDQIINLLHKPIYYSILFIGLTLTMTTLPNIPDSIEYILLGVFKSASIMIWSLAFFKIFMLLLNWYSKRNQANPLLKRSAISKFIHAGLKWVMSIPMGTEVASNISL